MWVEWDLLSIERISGSLVDEQNLQDLLTFSIARKANKLKSYTLRFTALISSMQIKQTGSRSV